MSRIAAEQARRVTRTTRGPDNCRRSSVAKAHEVYKQLGTPAQGGTSTPCSTVFAAATSAPGPTPSATKSAAIPAVAAAVAGIKSAPNAAAVAASPCRSATWGTLWLPWACQHEIKTLCQRLLGHHREASTVGHAQIMSWSVLNRGLSADAEGEQQVTCSLFVSSASA